MKSNSILRNILMLAAPVALFMQGSALAQGGAGTTTTTTRPPAQEPEAHAGTNSLAFWNNVDFYFGGGHPSEFLLAVDEQYKVDWISVSDIPPEMGNVRIPRLRLSRESMKRILPNPGPGRFMGGGGGGGGGPFSRENEERTPLDALVALYNDVSQAKPELGQMIVEGDPAKPSIVIFRSPAAKAPSDLKIKAFALRGIPDAAWDTLAAELTAQFEVLASFNQDEANPPKTHIAVHRDSSLLVVLGPESYVEAAESFVAAWHANHPDRRPQPQILPAAN
jgi:hypothetical protein